MKRLRRGDWAQEEAAEVEARSPSGNPPAGKGEPEAIGGEREAPAAPPVNPFRNLPPLFQPQPVLPQPHSLAPPLLPDFGVLGAPSSSTKSCKFRETVLQMPAPHASFDLAYIALAGMPEAQSLQDPQVKPQ